MPMLVLATGTPSRLATTVPASCVPDGIADGSAVSVTEPVPWAGTITWSADIASVPSGAGSPAPAASRKLAARSSVTGSFPSFVYVTVRSISVASALGHGRKPK
jgi:hypothetical protein